MQATTTNQNLYSHAKYGDQKYDNKADCEWVIEAEPGYHARIEFLAFEIEEETECG